MATIMLALLVLLVVFFGPLAAFAEPTGGFRLALNHIDSKSNFTLMERFRRASERSRNRREMLAAKVQTSSNSPDLDALLYAGPSPYGTEYLVEYEIGTPGVPVVAIADTGSDLIWTQCQPCTQCFPQSTPIFDPSMSSTFSFYPCTGPLCVFQQGNPTCTECDYTGYRYADNSSTSGVLSIEAFSFVGGSQGVELVFGCGLNNNLLYPNAAGIVGLGPNSLSLVSQLGSGRFSYCLTSYLDQNPSPLMLGSLAILNGSANAVVQTTALNATFHYYINLVGISVGETLLPIPDHTFDAGTIIDSGTSFTALPLPAYQLVSEEIIALVSLPLISTTEPLQYCFDLSSGSLPAMPTMTLHFDGGDMTFPMENYLLVDDVNNFACLTMSSSSDLSIVGNFQQQNINILYDLAGATLSFVAAQCDQL